jgi:hypothetical protein
MVWPKEKDACCGGGRRVLDERYNPPLRPEFEALLQSPHVSFNSRILNSALAYGSQGTFPSREHGGLGMYEQGLAFLHLMGKAYLVLRTPQEGCNPFDSHMLPQKVLFDGAAEDFGEDYAALLVAFRNYLNEHHPLSKRLSLARDMPGERIDLNSVVRLEAHGEQSGAMELAFLDSGVPRPADASNRVMYFDMKRKERGEKPNVSVSTHNALYEVLQFPLLFEEGKGGYYLSPDREDGVVSTTGERLSLQEYTRAMFYQNPRLHCLGRLAQEYALVQHSRHVENILNYQRYNLQAKLMRQRRDVGVAEGGVGKRLAMSTSVVGSVGYNQAL